MASHPFLGVSSLLLKLECTDEFHLNENLIKEDSNIWCKKGGPLHGRKCKDCSKKFVAKGPRSKEPLDKDHEFNPSLGHEAHYCLNLVKYGCKMNMIFCHDCFCKRLDKKGAASPRNLGL